MKTIIAAAICAVTTLASGVYAETISQPSSKSVSETMDALEAAVTGAGATVFARVDHGAGATSVDMMLPDAELLVFGNPMLGTPAMQADILAGLQLPLRVLVYQGADGTVVAYESIDQMFDGLSVPLDAAYVQKMTGALANLTAKAIEK